MTHMPGFGRSCRQNKGRRVLECPQSYGPTGISGEGPSHIDTRIWAHAHRWRRINPQLVCPARCREKDRALTRNQPAAIHHEFILFSFAAEDGMVFKHQALRLRRICLQ